MYYIIYHMDVLSNNDLSLLRRFIPIRYIKGGYSISAGWQKDVLPKKEDDCYIRKRDLVTHIIQCTLYV